MAMMHELLLTSHEDSSEEYAKLNVANVIPGFSPTSSTSSQVTRKSSFNCCFKAGQHCAKTGTYVEVAGSVFQDFW